MSCSANTAVVTWEPSDRVTSHIVRAIGSDGHRINCTSSNDSCILTSMHCGQIYNVTVAALDGACDSSNVLLVLQSGEATAPFVYLNTKQMAYILYVYYTII